MRILLLNPNSNEATTRAMVDIAQEAAGTRAQIEGITAPSGPLMIIDDVALKRAAELMGWLVGEINSHEPDAVIISGYGDPGLTALRSALDVPVMGIGEASLTEAAQYGPFAVATTTPGLAATITRMAERVSAHKFRGVFLTRSDPLVLAQDPAETVRELRECCQKAMSEIDLSAIIIGGGPLAVAARELRPEFTIPIVEPIPAAVRLLLE
jgi:Asp/Glu/hydantoin racemase